MEGIVTNDNYGLGWGLRVLLNFSLTFDFCSLASYLCESSPFHSSSGPSRKSSRRKPVWCCNYSLLSLMNKRETPTSFMLPLDSVSISAQSSIVAPLSSNFWLRYFLLKEQTEGTYAAYAINHIFYTFNINIFFTHQTFTELLLYANTISGSECSAINNKFPFLEVLILC